MEREKVKIKIIRSDIVHHEGNLISFLENHADPWVIAKILLKLNGKTIQWLAVRIGCSLGHTHRILSGETPGGKNTIRRIENTLKMTWTKGAKRVEL